MEIFRLFGSIFLEDTQAQQGLTNINNQAQSTGTTFKDMVGKAGTMGLAIGGAAVAAGGALLGLASNASDTASRVADMSAKMGISKTGFQEWDYVLSQAGVDVGVLQGSMKKFNGVLDDAGKGGKKQVEMFKELGLSMDDIKKMTPEQAFNATVKGLQGMEDGSHKSALASDLLGKSATEMGAILSGTSEDLEAAKQKAHEMGIVLSDEAVDAGDTFGDTMDNVKKSLGGLTTNIGVAVMPIVQGMLDWFMGNLPTMQAVVNTAFESIKNAFNFVIEAVTPIVDAVLPVLNEAFKYVAETVVPQLAQKFQEYMPRVEKVMQGMGEVIKTILNMVMEGFKFAWPYIKSIIQITIDAIGPIIDSLLGFIQGIIDFVMGVFTGDWQRAWDGIMGIFNSFNTLIETAVKFLLDIFAVIVKYIADGFTKAFQTAWDFIKDKVLKPVWDWIGTTFKGIWDTIKTAWDVALNAIKVVIELYIGFWKTVFLTIYNWIKDTFSTIFNFVKEALKKAWDTLGDTVKTIWDGIKESCLKVYNWLKDTFMGIFTLISDALGTAWNGLGEIVSGIWNSITTNIKAGINLVIGFVNSFINHINSLKISVPVVNVPLVGPQGGQTYGFNIPPIPPLATGTNYVPQDMLALIHKGEAVIPKKYNNGQQGLNVQVIVQGNLVGTNGMQELSDILSSEINRKFGLSIGGGGSF